MLIRLHEALDALRREDRGSTLVTTLIIMLVLTVGALVVGTVVVNTSGLVVSTRSSAESRAAADAGLADVVAATQSGDDVCNDPDGERSLTGAVSYTVTISCTADTATLVSTGRGAGGAETRTEAVYARAGVTERLSGALVSHNAGAWSQSVEITGTGGNIVLGTGDFRCAGRMDIAGSVIVRAGKADFSNHCVIDGDVITQQSVHITNTGTRIRGDVHALQGFTMSNPSHVDGSIYVIGDVIVQRGTVGGSIIATGSVRVELGAQISGGVRAGGTISISNAAVGGTATSSASGLSTFTGSTIGAVTSTGSVTLTSTTVQGDVRSGRDVQLSGSHVNGAITAGGTISGGAGTSGSTEVVLPAAPRVSPPWELGANALSWVDIPFTAAPPACPFRPATIAADIAKLSTYTSPRTIDARGCGSGLNLYGSTITLNTDITLLFTGIVYADDLNVVSADGRTHTFNIVVPDNTADKAPTCAAGSSGMVRLFGISMDPLIEGVAYSPCQLGIDSTRASNWNGIIYAGEIAPYGSGVTPLKLEYRDVTGPGGAPIGGGGIPGMAHLGALLSLKDVG